MGWPEECLLYPSTPDKVTDPACALFLEEEQFPFCEWPERARKGGPNRKGGGEKRKSPEKSSWDSSPGDRPRRRSGL